MRLAGRTNQDQQRQMLVASPEAPFITKVEDVVKAGDDFQSVMNVYGSIAAIQSLWNSQRQQCRPQGEDSGYREKLGCH